MNQICSIIIPFQNISPYLYETLDYINNLEDASFEVILLPDDQISSNEFNKYKFPILIIPTGDVSPAIKRDIGADQCQGSFLAFIDDDAFPKGNWLKKAIQHFKDQEVAAVGGPQITPHTDSFWQRVSGASFLPVVNGKTVDRYWPGSNTYEVEDWPSVNLVVRKKDFDAVKGFDSSYWPGEDTKLCHDLIVTLGKKIIYEPEAIVFHHRRAGFRKHMKQVGNYGLHRGFFAKRFPKTSLKLSYVIPSCFFLFVVLGWPSILAGGILTQIYFLFWCLYLISILISFFSIYIKTKEFFTSFFSLSYIIGTHFWYGLRFLQGFMFVQNLKSKLGR